MFNLNDCNGFTLVETLLYIALFAIVISGGMVAVYQVIESTDAAYNHVILQEEANFLFRKINWAFTGLDGSASIITPSTNIPYSDTTLAITKNIEGNPTRFTFTLTGGNLMLQEGSFGTIAPLNNSNIAVSLTPLTHLFSRIITAGKPDSVIIRFNLKTVQHGRSASQDFSMTNYLRK